MNKSITAILLFSTLSALGQAYAGTDDCTNTTTGDWSDAAIWDCNGVQRVPDVSDQVIIDLGIVTLDIDAVVLSVNANAGTNLNVGASVAGLSLTVTSGASSNLSVANTQLAGNFTLMNTGSQPMQLGAVDGGFALSLTSTSEFQLVEPLGAVTPLSSLTTNTGGNVQMMNGITTIGAQNYQGSMVLATDITLTSTTNGNITFRALDGAHNLIVNTAGSTGFLGAVGGITRLSSITTDTVGSNQINNGANTFSINGSGATTFGGNTTVGASTNIVIDQAGSGDIVFDGNVNFTSGSPHRLTINDVSGETRFNGTVFMGQLTTNDGAGEDKTVFAGATVMTNTGGANNGQMIFNDPVEVLVDIDFTEPGSGLITFNESLDGGADVVINSNNVVTLQDVGSNIALTTLTTDADGSTSINGNLTTLGSHTFNDQVVQQSNVVYQGSSGQFNQGLDANNNDSSFVYNSAPVTLPGGVINVNNLTVGQSTRNSRGDVGTFITADISTMGAQTYNDAVTVTNSVVLTGTGLTFNNSLQSGGLPIRGANPSLTLNTTNDGATTFNGNVSDTGSFSQVTTNSDGTTFIGANVTSNAITFNDPVVLNTNANITLSGAVVGQLVFNNTVDGSNDLVINQGVGDQTSFNGVIGGVARLSALATGQEGTTIINTSSIGTFSDQNYNNPVVLSSDVNLLTIDSVFFRSTLDGAHNLATEQPRRVEFIGNVGSVIRLQSVFINALLTVLPEEVNMNGSMPSTFNTEVLPATIRTTIDQQGSGDIVFNQLVSGGGIFAINTPGGGDTIFNGFVDLGENGITSTIETDEFGTTILNSNLFTTSENIIFNDPVILGAQILTIFSDNIQFMNTLDSDGVGFGRQVIIQNNDGIAAFYGNVGSDQPLGGFRSSSLGETLLAADMTVNVSEITFNNPVLIDNNPTITHSGVPIFSIAFNSTVSRASANAQSTLTLSTLEAGDVTFSGDVELDNLVVTEENGSAGIFADINTSGNQIYNGDVDIGGAQQLSADFIVFNNTASVFSGVSTFEVRSAGSMAVGTISRDGGIIKAGAGELNLVGDNTYTGTTTVDAGTLIIDGSLDAASTVNVNGGTLSGNGTVNGQVDINAGNIAPGSSPGILNTGDLLLDSNTNYFVEINGLIPDSEHDQINVTGTVSINNATLDLSGSYIPFGMNDAITLIRNDGVDPVTGIFLGLPEGGIISNNGPFTISYIGGDGNDVVLIDDEGLFADSFESADE